MWWSDESRSVCLRARIGGGVARVDARRSDDPQVVVWGRNSGIIPAIINERRMINSH